METVGFCSLSRSILDATLRLERGLAHPVDALLRKLRQSSVETGTASNAVGASRRRRRPVVLRAKASPDPIHLAIHRVDLSVYFKRLDPEAFTLLTALNAGASLEGACASAFAKSSASAEEASGKVREWFATGRNSAGSVPFVDARGASESTGCNRRSSCAGQYASCF